MVLFEGFFNPARNTDNEIIGLAKLVEVVAIRFLLYLLTDPIICMYLWDFFGNF